MSGQEAVFVLFALVAGGSAVLMVTSKNLVHAVLYLAGALSGVAGVFLVLHADFIAMVQLIVYVGSVVVLIVFGLMLTRAPIGREALDSQQRGLGAAVSVALFGVLAALIIQAYRDQFSLVAAAKPAGPTSAGLGIAIFSGWVLPFEVVSLLLLAALVGAIVLSRREAGETGPEEDERIITGMVGAGSRVDGVPGAQP